MSEFGAGAPDGGLKDHPPMGTGFGPVAREVIPRDVVGEWMSGLGERALSPLAGHATPGVPGPSLRSRPIRFLGIRRNLPSGKVVHGRFQSTAPAIGEASELLEKQVKGTAPFPRNIKVPERFALCFSHLRWDFVFQRPQHLMRRLSAEMPLIFWEEPVFRAELEIVLETFAPLENLTVARLLLPGGTDEGRVRALQRQHLDELILAHGVVRPVLWYYSPMMLGFSEHLQADVVVYDCMDELSAFRGAPPAMKGEEFRLMERADVVFTGGQSLYEARRAQHPNVHLFPSSVDLGHFRTARERMEEPGDQRVIPVQDSGSAA